MPNSTQQARRNATPATADDTRTTTTRLSRVNQVNRGGATTVIAASPERCFDVALAFEQYPQWAKDIDEAAVVRRDDQGRALEVEFRASAIGRSTHYTLAYDYSQAPSVLSWSLVRGDITKASTNSCRSSAGRR